MRLVDRIALRGRVEPPQRSVPDELLPTAEQRYGVT
jgi:hypothetical protein